MLTSNCIVQIEDLRLQEVFEHPGLEHGDGPLRQAALRPPAARLLAATRLPRRPMFLDQSRLQAPLHVPGRRRRRRLPPAGGPAVRRRHDPAPQAAVHRRHGAVRERRADAGAALLHQGVELGRGAPDLVQASAVLVIQLQTTLETDLTHRVKCA
jgi:hypothetical protein